MARKKSYYLKLTLKGTIQEDRLDLPFFHARTLVEFREIIELLEAARKHRKVGALLLVVKPVSIGWSQIEEIQEQIEAFHAAGKASVCYLEVGDNQSYYLASSLQKVFLSPTAQLDLIGLRAETLYFHDLLEFVGVEPELFSIGKFKSAAEILTRRDMSEANREMTGSILADLQGRLTEKVARARRVSVETVQRWIDGGPHTARHAKDLGLVDDLLYEDEAEERLKRERPNARPIRSSRLTRHEGFFRRLVTRHRPQIGYIVAEGIVTQGTSKKGLGRRASMGAETLKELLESARENKRTKAVVLRINSPGGSGLASDLIWHEVQKTREKKPVIASFSSVAASGGYYLALGADCILAMPSTLTGSIGVIGGKFNIRGLLDRLKIAVDALELGERAGYFSPTRPFTEAEAEVVRNQIVEFYETFLERVRDGRRMPEEGVRKISEGRVWTGHQAREIQLIDKAGGLSRAFELAREKAGLGPRKKVRIVHYYQRRSWRDIVTLPFLESMEHTRIWALPLFWWKIR